MASSRAHGASVDTGMFPADLRDRGPYGVVVFNDVFEHIPDPGGVVREVARLLTPGGLLVLNVPSSRGVIFRIARAMDRAGVSAPYERLWQVGFPSPHLHYFSPENLRTTVERHTYLRQVDVMTLPSMSRAGLFERTRASMGAFGAGVATAALWPSTFLLDRLPADIHVGFFARTLGPDER